MPIEGDWRRHNGSGVESVREDTGDMHQGLVTMRMRGNWTAVDVEMK